MQSRTAGMVTFSDIEAAAEVLRPVAHRTPLLSSRTFNNLTANEVYFKAENFQRVGAFKFRGAYNAFERDESLILGCSAVEGAT